MKLTPKAWPSTWWGVNQELSKYNFITQIKNFGAWINILLALCAFHPYRFSTIFLK